MSKQKGIERDATGKVYNTYYGKDIPINNSHPIYQFITTDKILQHYIIFNDKNMIGGLFIGSDGRFYVISLPTVGIDG